MEEFPASQKKLENQPKSHSFEEIARLQIAAREYEEPSANFRSI